MKSLIIEGKNTFSDWGMVLTSKELTPPTPKYYKVDVPGGDGSINLTHALSGDTSYHNRSQRFVFTLIDRGVDFERAKTGISNALHGKEFDYQLSWDPGYTYRGWFTVDEYVTEKALNQLAITIDAEPYKSKGLKTEFFNVSDGITAHLSSGRKRVKPILEFSADVIVVFEGKRYVIPKGSHTINDVWFKQGVNEITFVLADQRKYITWGELERFSWRELKQKAYWEWYKGIEKHSVSKIVIEGMETPVTGVIAFTATDNAGNVFTQELNLGDLKLARVGDDFDTVTIYDGSAFVRKIIDDAAMTALPLPKSYALSFPVMFSNEAEIVSLVHDSSANVTYETETINVALDYSRAKYADYVEGGKAAATFGEMEMSTWAQLTMINNGAVAVSDTPQESVFVQYEWSDL